MSEGSQSLSVLIWRTASFEMLLVFARISISELRTLSVSRGVPRSPIERWMAVTLLVIWKMFWAIDRVSWANSGEGRDSLETPEACASMSWRSWRSLNDIYLTGRDAADDVGERFGRMWSRNPHGPIVFGLVLNSTDFSQLTVEKISSHSSKSQDVVPILCSWLR